MFLPTYSYVTPYLLLGYSILTLYLLLGRATVYLYFPYTSTLLLHLSQQYPTIYYSNPSVTLTMERQHASRCRRLPTTRAHLKLNVTNPIVSPTIHYIMADAPQAMWRSRPARIRGAIMPCLIFLFLFASRQKERIKTICKQS